ncbi:hypothetical protein G6F45_013586 [Rhizopus arrhizus]|nr:hypothetical protein G6F52_013521 [Rhizopus delemar]KAG1608457.1 hypothetical protein G6F45_013586 [Rhizopus arrhizus]
MDQRYPTQESWPFRTRTKGQAYTGDEPADQQQSERGSTHPGHANCQHQDEKDDDELQYTGWNPRAAAARRRSLFLAEREATVAQVEAAVPKGGEETDSLAPFERAAEETAVFELGVLVGTPADRAASSARKEAISLA